MVGSASGMHRLLPNAPSTKDTVLIWGTGASFGLTPFWSNFIDCVECNNKVKDVTKVSKVVGISTTLNKFKGKHGQMLLITE